MYELNRRRGSNSREELLVVVRVRSGINRDTRTLETLRALRLERPQTAVLLWGTPQLKGQLARIKDVAFWGPIEKSTLVRLLEKRGRMVGDKRILVDRLKERTGYTSIEDLADALLTGKVKFSEIECLKHFFRLSPVSCGSRKRSDVKRGLLGYLGKRADSVLAKMI